MQPSKTICDNALSIISRVEIAERFSKKSNKSYNTLTIHFKKHKYQKTIFLDDLEVLLFEKLLSETVDSDEFLNKDEERSL